METPVVTSKILNKHEGNFLKIYLIFNIIFLEKQLYNKNKEIKEEQGDEEPFLNFKK